MDQRGNDDEQPDRSNMMNLNPPERRKLLCCVQELQTQLMSNSLLSEEEKTIRDSLSDETFL